MRRRRGFSLLEVIASISILTILLAMGVFAYSRHIGARHMSDATTQLGQLLAAARQSATAGQTTTVTFTSGAGWTGTVSVGNTVLKQYQAASDVSLSPQPTIVNFQVGGSVDNNAVYTLNDNKADESNTLYLYEATGGISSMPPNAAQLANAAPGLGGGSGVVPDIVNCSACMPQPGPIGGAPGTGGGGCCPVVGPNTKTGTSTAPGCGTNACGPNTSLAHTAGCSKSCAKQMTTTGCGGNTIHSGSNNSGPPTTTCCPAPPVQNVGVGKNANPPAAIAPPINAPNTGTSGTGAAGGGGNSGGTCPGGGGCCTTQVSQNSSNASDYHANDRHHSGGP